MCYCFSIHMQTLMIASLKASQKKIIRKNFHCRTVDEHATDQIDASGSQTENCIVCRDRNKDTLLRPCNHAKFCRECIETLIGNGTRNCPYCRDTFTDYEQVFLW